MNAHQKLATLSALGLIVISACFAPFQVVTKNTFDQVSSVRTEYRFILAPPDKGFQQSVKFSASPVLVSWLLIGILYAGSCALLRR